MSLWQIKTNTHIRISVTLGIHFLPLPLSLSVIITPITFPRMGKFSSSLFNLAGLQAQWKTMNTVQSF
jgi:hypothetical protein